MTSFADPGAVHRAIDGLAQAFARRRTRGQVYMGGESDPTPGEQMAARQYIQDLLDAGWVPPIFAATHTKDPGGAP